jgi:hypothetical protein
MNLSQLRPLGHPPPTWERAADGLRLDLRLSRRPRRLEEFVLAKLRLFLADLWETIRRDYKLRDFLRGLITSIMEDANE